MYYSIHCGTQRIAMNYFYVVCLNFALVGKKITTRPTERTQIVSKLRLICIKEERGGSKFYFFKPIKNIVCYL